MTEQNLLIIDSNPQNLSALEVQLRSSGYEVSTAPTTQHALKILSVTRPDLIIANHQGGEGEVVELCRRLKSEVTTEMTPFVILVNQADQRAEALSAGADEVLVQPIYIAELRDRVSLLLQRQHRLGLERGAGQKFFGRLEEMGLLDLLQVIEVSKRSGQLMIDHQGERGSLWFQEGALHDGELGKLQGYEAVQRLLTWEFGQYEFDFKAEPRENRIQRGLSEVKSEGLQYVDQWSKICEQLPPLTTVFRGDPAAISERSEPLNALQGMLIKRFDGELSAHEILNRSPEPDLDVLRELTQLYFEGLIYEVREIPSPDEPEQAFLDPIPSGVLPSSVLNDQFDPSTSPSFEPPDLPNLLEQSAPDLDQPSGSELEDLLGFDIETKIPPVPEVDDAEGSGEEERESEESDATPPPMPDLMADDQIDPELSEEGQDILAELYAAPPELTGEGLDSPDFSPPPIPQDLLPDDDQADETFSTLFGVDGEFAYDDEEISFFNEQLEEEVFGEEPERAPMSRSAKIFWGLLAITIAGTLAFVLRDRVEPFKMTMTAAQARTRVAQDLRSRELNAEKLVPASGEWRIDLNRQVKFNTPPIASTARSGARPAKTRSTRRSGGSPGQLKKLLKQALKLKRKGKYKQAAEVAEQALEIQSQHKQALLIAASSYNEVNNNSRSLAHLQTLLNVDARYGDAQVDPYYKPGIVYMLTAVAFQRLKNKNKALEYYKRYLREFPSGPFASEVQGIINRL